MTRKKAFKISLALVVAFGGAALLPPSALAYCLNGLRWFPGSLASENVYYNSSGKVTSGQCISSPAMDAQVTNAIGVWDVLKYNGTTTKKANAKDDQNTVGWANLGGTTLGITNYLKKDRFLTKFDTCGGGPWAELYEADVRLSKTFRWTDGVVACPCAAGSAYSLGSVSEHEFGHVIGLCHENDFDTLMNSSIGACLNDRKGSDESAGENALCY